MGAGNGSVVVLSDRITDLHKGVFAHQPQYKHYTTLKRYMVVVLHKPKQGIMIYEFERSIKPLLRTVVDDDGEVRTIIRDFFDLEDGIKVLQHLLRMVENQAGRPRPASASHNPELENKQTITLCPEGRVIMGGYQPTYDVAGSTPPTGR